MVSKKAGSITPYTAGEQLFGDYIRLNTNENPYPPSKAVKAALAAFDISALKFYPDPEGTALKAALAEYEGIDAESIFLGNGSDEVLYLAFNALFDSCVAFPEVTYSFYPIYADMLGISYTTVPMLADFRIDTDAFKNNTFGGIVIANPNAPTTVSLPLSEIESIVKCAKCNVIIDEAYIDFADKTSTAAKLVQKYPNLTVVKTFSKSRSLAGLRCGYAIANKEHINALKVMRDSFNSYTLDRIAQTVATASVGDKAYFADTVERIKKTRARVLDAVRAAGYKVSDSDANFLFIEMGGSARDFYEYCKRNHVLIRHWNKPLISGYVRVTVGTDAEMDRFLELLTEFGKI